MLEQNTHLMVVYILVPRISEVDERKKKLPCEYEMNLKINRQMKGAKQDTKNNQQAIHTICSHISAINKQ